MTKRLTLRMTKRLNPGMTKMLTLRMTKMLMPGMTRIPVMKDKILIYRIILLNINLSN